eukprot:scpid98922/ scgid34444/ 
MDLPADAYQPLEDVICQFLIPALTGRNPPGSSERAILALPCRLGGLGLIDPTLLCNQYGQSVQITECLVSRILEQHWSIDGVAAATRRAKSDARMVTRQLEANNAASIYQQIDADSKRIIDLSSEKGASSWLTCRPLKRHGFRLHKTAFRDGLCLRFGWIPERMPSHCSCARASTSSTPYLVLWVDSHP